MSFARRINPKPASSAAPVDATAAPASASAPPPKPKAVPAKPVSAVPAKPVSAVPPAPDASTSQRRRPAAKAPRDVAGTKVPPKKGKSPAVVATIAATAAKKRAAAAEEEEASGSASEGDDEVPERVERETVFGGHLAEEQDLGSDDEDTASTKAARPLPKVPPKKNSGVPAKAKKATSASAAAKPVAEEEDQPAAAAAAAEEEDGGEAAPSKSKKRKRSASSAGGAKPRARASSTGGAKRSRQPSEATIQRRQKEEAQKKILEATEVDPAGRIYATAFLPARAEKIVSSALTPSEVAKLYAVTELKEVGPVAPAVVSQAKLLPKFAEIRRDGYNATISAMGKVEQRKVENFKNSAHNDLQRSLAFHGLLGVSYSTILFDKQVGAPRFVASPDMHNLTEKYTLDDILELMVIVATADAIPWADADTVSFAASLKKLIPVDVNGTMQPSWLSFKEIMAIGTRILASEAFALTRQEYLEKAHPNNAAAATDASSASRPAQGDDQEEAGPPAKRRKV